MAPSSSTASRSSPTSEVIAELVAVKGLGVWSAHMFLMFTLQRPDVLAVGDLGIRRAVMLAYGLPELPAPPSSRSSPSRGAPTGRSRACTCGSRSTRRPPDLRMDGYRDGYLVPDTGVLGAQ